MARRTTLRKSPQAPSLFNDTPQTIQDRTDKAIERARKSLDRICAETTPDEATFETILEPIGMVFNKILPSKYTIGLYSILSPDIAVRSAATKATQLFSNFENNLWMREDLYHLVDAVMRNRTQEDLDPESNVFLSKVHKQFIRSGVCLPAGPARERYKVLRKRLNQEVIPQFQRNVNETQAKAGIWLSREELDGAPDHLLQTLKQGEGPSLTGKLWVPFLPCTIFPLLTYVKDAEIRCTLSRSYSQTCATKNISIFKEVVALRYETARLLGYPSHASLEVEEQTARTPENVTKLVEQLRRGLISRGNSEIATLKLLKQSSLKEKDEKQDGRYYEWDNRYFGRLLREKHCSADDQQLLSEYFPLNSTLRKLLHIFENLFGLVFEEVTSEDRDVITASGNGSDLIWQENVQMFAVWNDADEGQSFVGYLYLDLFARPGKPLSHPFNLLFHPGYFTTPGDRVHPSTALVCNLTRPTASKPTLLSHEELISMLHELGQSIHDLICKAKYASLHDSTRDFKKVPSLVLENWGWDPSLLKWLGQHYSYLSPQCYKEWLSNCRGKSRPPEKCPDDLITRLIKAKHCTEGLAKLTQTMYATFDMMVHHPDSYEALEELNIPELYLLLRSKMSLLDFQEENAIGYNHELFNALVQGSNANYYSYLSSQIYADDIYHAIFKSNPNDRYQGRKYRHVILENLCSNNAMKLLEELLGRKPKSDAFFKEMTAAEDLDINK